MKRAGYTTAPYSTQFMVLLLFISPVVANSTITAPNKSGGSDVQDISQELRKECADVLEEAQQVRQEAYAALSKACEVKDSEYSARDGLESVLVEVFALLKSQALDNSIKNILAAVAEKMDRLEVKMEEIGGKLEERTAQLEEKVESSIALSTSVRDRQQVWMSEIRLISLYKTVDQNNGHPGYPNPIVTDGNFVINNVPDYIATHSHTKSKAADNKLWISLGGYFKIHRVYIWNYRACCLEQLVGTHVYADDRLIGTVIKSAAYHDFLIPANDPTYASTITLHQPLPKNIHVLEVQVWGNGPFNRNDVFA